MYIGRSNILHHVLLLYVEPSGGCFLAADREEGVRVRPGELGHPLGPACALEHRRPLARG
jgi:hypothetical protein